MYGAPGELTDALALEVLGRYGVVPHPIIDVDALATAMGVSAVVRLPLLEDGRIDRMDSGRVVIMLNERAAEPRQRFTLAHELGHLILMSDNAASFTAQRTRQSFTTEESLCDSLASGLLMPRPWVRSQFVGPMNDLEVVQKLAHAANVSLSAALVRLREVLGWRHSLLHWTADAGRWQLDGEAGIFPAQRGLVRSLTETDWHLTYWSAQGGGAIVRCNLPIATEGERRELPVQLSVRRGSAIALLRLPDPGVKRPSPRARRLGGAPLKDVQRRRIAG